MEKASASYKPETWEERQKSIAHFVQEPSVRDRQIEICRKKFLEGDALAVGHQFYVHKILTGRAKLFENLRSIGGLSGFPLPLEVGVGGPVAEVAGDSFSPLPDRPGDRPRLRDIQVARRQIGRASCRERV